MIALKILALLGGLLVAAGFVWAMIDVWEEIPGVNEPRRK